MSFLPFYGPSTPFFSGSFADPRSIPFTVNLDGMDLPIDLKQYRHNGIERYRNGVVTSDETNDALLNPEGAWWRYRFSWHRGAGQEIDELDEGAVAARYEQSRGVDPWTRYQLCLLKATETKNKTLTAAAIKMVATGTLIYVSDGTSVQRCADLTAGTPTWTTITGIAGTVTALATDGTDVFVGTTVDIYRVTPASAAASTFGSTAQPVTALAVAGNRLIGADDNEIGEAKVAAPLDVVYTHFQPGFKWTTIFGVGSRIYLGGYSGNRSEIYTTQVDTTTGALAIANEAATLASGELIYDALSYAGIVVIATSKGIRIAQPTGDGTLTYGPLIDDYGACYALTAEGRFVWGSVENFPGTGTGLVRVALDEFNDTLLPAYAPDVFTEATSGQITAVARFGGETVFTVASNAVYGESDSYLMTGYLDSGDITFGTVEDKSISSVRVRYEGLAANESVRIDLSSRDGTAIGNKTDTVDGSEELTLDVVGNAIDRARVRITLNGDGTTTPCLTEWRMRAFPIAPGVEEWLVPLIIHSRVVVNDSEGQMLSLSPWEVTERLRSKWQSQDIVLYKEGDYSFRVRIDNFQIGTDDWRDGSDYFEMTCTVRLLST